MVMPSLPHRTTAWFTACLSCLLLLGLAGLSAVIAFELASVIAYNKLTAAFESPHWQQYEVERSVTMLLEQPHINRFLYALIYPHGSAADKEKQELYQIISFFRLGQNQAAVDSARILIANMEQNLEELPVSHMSAHLSALLVKARSALTNYTVEQREMRKKLSDQSQAQAEIRRLANQLILLANDLGELLSLPPEHWDQKSGSIDVYKEGVLSELPKLKGLRDGIADLVALRDELERVGGAVRIDAENQHEIFTKRVAELRNLSRQIVSSTANLNSEINTRDEEIKTLASKHDLSSAALRNALERLFVSQTRPKLYIFDRFVRRPSQEKS